MSDKGKEPLRKKFAKGFRHGAAGIAFVAAATGTAVVSNFNYFDGSWDETAHAQSETVIQDFNSAMTEMENLLQTREEKERALVKAELADQSGKARAIEGELKRNAETLKRRATATTKMLIRSEDLNERDAQTLAIRFNDAGLDKYTAFQKSNGGYTNVRLSTRDMNELQEYRAEYLPEHGVKDTDYINVASSLNDDFDAAFGSVFVGFVTFIVSGFAWVGTADGLNGWSKLPNKPSNPKNNKNGQRGLFTRREKLKRN